MVYYVRWLAGLASGIVLAASVALPVLAADTKPPTVPGNFQVVATEGSPALKLTWSASTDESGGVAYYLERSLDQATWSALGDAVAVSSFEDKSAGYGVHYYYRLQAKDQAGNASGWAAADIETESYRGGQLDQGEGSTFSSEDSLALVTVPKGAVLGNPTIDCTVSSPASTTKQIDTSERSVVLGPYVLVCKTIAGIPVYAFEKPIIWQLNVNNKLNGFDTPRAYKLDSSGGTTLLDTQSFNDKSQMVSAAQTTVDPVVVMAAKPKGVVPVNIIVILLAVGLLVWGLIVFMIKRKRKNDHENYLRSKYYNL